MILGRAGSRGVALPREVRHHLPGMVKSSFSITVMCTASHRITGSASTNQEPEKGDLTHEVRHHLPGMVKFSSQTLRCKVLVVDSEPNLTIPATLNRP